MFDDLRSIFTRRESKKEQKPPGEEKAKNGFWLGLISIIFFFAKSMAWIACILGAIAFICVWMSRTRDNYSGQWLIIGFIASCVGFVGGLVAYLIYVF